MPKSKIFFLSSVLYFLFSVLCPLSSVFSYAEPIAVIVNKTNPKDNVSLSELKRIYEAKTREWPNGFKIMPINRESTSDIRLAFSRLVHKKTPKQMKDYWYERQYKGIRKPIVQTSVALIEQIVSQVDRAVGYVYLSEVDDRVKVLRIDGLAPGDEGYKLRSERGGGR
ncbi:MAG: substrate-binding domain-containing protein [Candidatus Omnitrophota bacterium]